ncbi:MAG: branched-chain amino acid ABC transporter permease [Thermoanaerobacteraceae bacterium]|nr:branched-chain amino acid ABC transporter permease [Thermoanaerobacteraceae bacterium]
MYGIVVAINVGIFAILALSVNIITGYAGQPNLGQASFFGIGAYTTAILAGKYGVGFLPSLIISGFIAGIVGLLLGLASLRVRDDFLAITTIGFNFVVVAIFQYVPFFGASMGLSIPPLKLFGYPVGYVGLFIIILLLMLLVILFTKRMERSWIGIALVSIRNNEEAAESLGIDTRKFKVISFGIGTLIAGFAGSVYAYYMGFIMSYNFQFMTSITILSMAVVGGLGTIAGPIIGAIVLGLAPEIFRFVSDYRLLIYGAILILMMSFQPQGLVGDGSIFANIVRKLRPKTSGVDQ